MKKIPLFSLTIITFLLIPFLLIPTVTLAMEGENKEDKEQLSIQPRAKKGIRGHRRPSDSGDSREEVHVDDLLRTPTLSSHRSRADFSDFSNSNVFRIAQSLGGMLEQIRQIQRRLGPIERSMRERAIAVDREGRIENVTVPICLPASNSHADGSLMQEIDKIKAGLEVLEGEHHEIRAALDRHVEDTNEALSTIRESQETILFILLGRGSAPRNILRRILEAVEARRDVSDEEADEDAYNRNEDEESGLLIHCGNEDQVVDGSKQRNNVGSAATATALRRQHENEKRSREKQSNGRSRRGRHNASGSHGYTRHNSREPIPVSNTPVVPAQEVRKSTAAAAPSSDNSLLTSNSSSSSSSSASSALSSSTVSVISQPMATTSGSSLSSSTSSSSTSSSNSNSAPERTLSAPVGRSQNTSMKRPVIMENKQEGNGWLSTIMDSASSFIRDATSADGILSADSNSPKKQ